MMTALEVEQLYQWYPVLAALSSALATQFRQDARILRVPTGTTLFDLDYPCNDSTRTQIGRNTDC